MIIERIVLNEIMTSVTLTAYIQMNPFDTSEIGSAGVSTGSSNDDAHLLCRPAVIICPGGGYLSLAEDEAEYVALQFLAKGYQAFVLSYSIGAPYARFPAPFLDLADAVICVRERASRYRIDPEKVAILGLSTGGHVASILGTLWHSSLFPNKLARPDAMILGFPILDLTDFETKLLEKNPVYTAFLEMMAMATLGTKTFKSSETSKWSSIAAVSEQTIPTFIWSYASDEMVGRSQISVFTKSLESYRIPHEAHVFEDGKHGSVISKHETDWLDLAIKWLKKIHSDTFIK